jgi:hypothetical protein
MSEEELPENNQSDQESETNQKKLQDNDALELKPDDVARKNFAPRGTVGMSYPEPHPTSFAPSNNSPDYQPLEQSETQTIKPEKDQSAEPPIKIENEVFAVETGDKEVDEQTAKNHTMMSKEDYEDLEQDSVEDILRKNREQQNRDRDR